MELDPAPGPGHEPRRHPPRRGEPYFFHFPDGNATLARLLVRRAGPRRDPGPHRGRRRDGARRLRPARRAGVPGAHAPQQHRRARARTGARPARAREVDVTYVRGGRLQTVRGTARASWPAGTRSSRTSARSCPQPQKEALAYAVKVPDRLHERAAAELAAFQKLGVAPASTRRAATTPLQPGPAGERRRVPASRGAGGADRRAHGAHAVPARACPRASSTAPAAIELLATTFDTFERKIREQLARTLGPAASTPRATSAAITVNRWPHGYAYQYNSLWDPFWLDGRRAAVRGGAPAASAASPSPTPTPPRTRTRTRPSTRPTARSREVHGLSREARVRPRAGARGPAALLGLRHPHHRHPRLRGEHGRDLVRLVGDHDGAVLRPLRPHHRRAGRGLAGRGRPLRVGARGDGPALGIARRLVLLDQQRLLGARPSTWCSRAPSTRSSCARTCRPSLQEGPGATWLAGRHRAGRHLDHGRRSASCACRSRSGCRTWGRW